MRGRKQKDSTAPTTAAAATPFFARFLEDQHGVEAKAAARLRSLKYPSDRDEDGDYSTSVEAAQTNAGPSRQTLKYPSDRDEIDFYVAPHADAADAR